MKRGGVSLTIRAPNACVYEDINLPKVKRGQGNQSVVSSKNTPDLMKIEVEHKSKVDENNNQSTLMSQEDRPEVPPTNSMTWQQLKPQIKFFQSPDESQTEL